MKMKIVKLICKYFPFAAGALLSACEGNDNYDTSSSFRNNIKADTVTIKWDENYAVNFENAVYRILENDKDVHKILVKINQETKHETSNFNVRDWGHVRNAICSVNSKCAQENVNLSGADTLFVNPLGGASLSQSHYNQDLERPGMQANDSSVLAGLIGFRIMQDHEK